MKALVTGGGGFLGGALVRQLVERGDTVRSFSRNHYPALQNLGVDQATGNLADAGAVDRAVAGCEIVYHVGAKAGIWGAFQEYYAVNVLGTQNIITACRKHGVPRLVYTSSPSVVFHGGDLEGVDESVPYADHFEAPYPETKARAEQMVLAANGESLATVALRPHLIFGPDDPHLFPRIVAKARSGRLRLIGDGSNQIDFVYVDNAARAHVLAGDKLAPGTSIGGKAYFITNGRPVSVKEIFDEIMNLYDLPPLTRRVSPKLAYFGGVIFEKIYKMLGIRAEPIITPFLARELSTAHWFDISAARQDLGYEPEITLEEGLERIKSSLQPASA
ncbi:MAG: NAD-dependent epimerase/dehydratase family protein [Desulfosudaceae bacterium]